MRLQELEKAFHEAEELYRGEKHDDVLITLKQVEALAPANHMALFLRARSLAALGRNSEALNLCEDANTRLQRTLQDAQSLGPLLDRPQIEMLSRAVTLQESQVNALRASLDARLAEGLNKAELQHTIQALQSELTSLRSKAGNADESESLLRNQMDALREQEESKNRELDGARAQLNKMQEALQQREDAMQQAAREQAERDQAMAKLQQELRALQEQAQGAADSERKLSTELAQLRQEELDKAANLSQTRTEIESLQQKLAAREQMLQASEARDAERDTVIAEMRTQLESLQGKAEEAATSERALQKELDALRVDGNAKADALEQARQEMERLRGSLDLREQDVAEAEARSRQQQEALDSLQQELGNIRSRAEQAAQSERELAAELEALRNNEREKAQALEATRAQMEALQGKLGDREAEAARAMQQSNMTAEAKAALELELNNLRQQAEQFKQSEGKLLGELDNLRSSHTEKSGVLDSARGELDALRDKMRAQESAYTTAEQDRIEQAAKVADMQGELATLRSQAESASRSEIELAREVEKLKANESAASQALSAAQGEVEMLRQALADREQHMESTHDIDPEAMQSLQEELVELHARAEEARRSEQMLAKEMQQMRSNEESKSRQLERAREQMKSLEESVKDRERIANEALEEKRRTEKLLSELKQELGGLRSRTQDASISSDELEVEINKLRQEGGVKAEYLERAKAELDALRDAVRQRDDAIARSEHLLKRVKGQKRPPFILYALVAGLLLVSGFLIYDRASQPEAPVVVVKPELLFPMDRSLGNLYTRDAASTDEADWQPHVPAQGVVPVKDGLVYHLKVADDAVEDLSPLATLDTQYLQSIWLPGINMTDQNLQALSALKDLDRLYLDATATDEERAKLQQALPLAAISSKPPEVVAFVEATSPPPVRTLTFPPDRSMGRVFVRTWTLNLEDDWDLLGDARGTIEIPAGKDAKLEVESDIASDLTALANLDPYALHTISLNGKNVTDQSFSFVSHLLGLRGLALKYTAVTAQGIYHLEPLKRLEWIEFYQVPMDDDGLKVFSRFEGLRHLWLVGSGISNASLGTLRAMNSLRRLHIATSLMSTEGLIALNHEMPFCEVTPKPDLQP
jgi:predicted  nucleic acid-binding Zn-ribbon protein